MGGAGSQALSCAGRVPRWLVAQGFLVQVACQVSDTARGSQFRRRQAGRWGQASGLILFKGGRLQNGRWPSPHVCGIRRSLKRLLSAVCPQGELQLPPASLGDSLRPSGGSDPDNFHVTASDLGPEHFPTWVSRFCVHPATGVYFLQHSGSPKSKHLQNHVFWGLAFLVRAGDGELSAGR